MLKKNSKNKTLLKKNKQFSNNLQDIEMSNDTDNTTVQLENNKATLSDNEDTDSEDQYCDKCGQQHGDDSDDEHIQCTICSKYVYTSSYDKDVPRGWVALNHYAEDCLWDGLCPRHSRIPEKQKLKIAVEQLQSIMEQLSQNEEYILFCKNNPVGQKLNNVLNKFIEK